MQALPSIDVLGFLNWLNIEGYPKLQTHILLDELFLNINSNRERAYALARDYLANRRFYDLYSREDIATEYLDMLISIFRSRAIEQIRRNYVESDDLRHLYYIFEEAFHKTIHSLNGVTKHSNYHQNHMHGRSHHFVRQRRERHDISERELVDSVQFYLTHHTDPIIASLISSTPHSIANYVCSFLHHLSKYSMLKNINIHNIPADIMEKAIDQYMWRTYSTSFCSDPERQHIHTILNQVFIEHKYHNYLRRVLPYTEFNDVVRRLFNRHVRFKCTLLSDDDFLSRFVTQNWQELNDYSSDHLDIYYNEQELLRKGYLTADKLNIRNNIDSYPCLYLWEYDLKDGHAISIGNLMENELLDVFKSIIEQIIRHENLSSIAQYTTELILQIQTARAVRDEEEQTLTQLILNACRQLQNQRIWYQHEGKHENIRNTYIASLISGNNFIVKDQTLGGKSSSGISIGENDIKIFRNQNQPFAIIEALNLSALHAKDWNHKNFREHVNRLYGYDTNGLARNYLLLYADTPMFDKYWESVLHEFTITHKCKFGDAEFVDVTDLEELSQTDLRIGVVRYRRNGRIVKLYVIAVLMDDKTHELPASK